MSRLHAFKTEVASALADDISLLHRWIDNCIIAVGCGTVLSLLIIRDK
jgi:hypothetical protein